MTIASAGDGRLGPAMQRLTEKQQNFVVELLSQGKLNLADAAHKAGYGTSTSTRQTLAVIGHRLGHDERILAAVREEGQRRMTVGVAVGVGRLLHILENSVDEKNQLKAIEMMFNRVGLHPRTEHHNINHTVENEGDKLDRALALCKTLGLDPKSVLGAYMPAKGAVVDAEFTEVEQPEAIPPPEGLEDLW